MSKARETANITQQGLADAIGVEVRTIGKAKSSDENPEFDTRVRIVRFLHIPSVNTVSPENEREESDGKTSIFWHIANSAFGLPPVMIRKSCYRTPCRGSSTCCAV